MARKKKQGQPGDDSDFEAPAPVEETSENFNKDEEGNDLGGLMSVMAKKKAKKNKKARNDDDEDAAEILAKLDQQDAEPQEVPAKSVEKVTQSLAEVELDDTPKLKSKKEKEKERKERQKQAQKASQPKKVEPVKQVEPEAPVPEATSGPKKKKAGGIAALKELLEAKKRMEEEQARLEAEEAAREREEEARLEEERRKQAEQRAAKKEREKQKKEELKKQGKWLSDKQKKEQERARERLQQMLASQGVTVAALSGDAPKKPVYGKKKPPQKKQTPVEEKKEDDGVKDSWDQTSDEDVKDTWEQSSESEEEKVTPVEAREEKTVVKPSKPSKESSESESESSEDASLATTEATATNTANQTVGDMRSPIFVVLGHVDTGKTKLLDKIRQTNVQEGEAGGITQQIGATYFPIEAIRNKTEPLLKTLAEPYEYHVPGLLGIDTPGHESFSNLRSRGSSLCNIAILVVDIMHGLEPQTIESIQLLKKGKTPFVVALNKIDRIYGWKVTPDGASIEGLKHQSPQVLQEFKTRSQNVITQFAEQGLNAVLYYDNTNFARNVSLVPTSAMTGEGVPDLLHLVVKLTQERMSKDLLYLSDLSATVLEVKVVEGLGTTIDVILSNGELHEGDRVVLCGMNGPIATTIRALLTPQPMKEIRVKSPYVHHKTIKAAMGVKIAANDLDKAIAGSRLLVVGPKDDEEELMDDVQDDLLGLMSSIDKSGIGVCVQASTLGSLEALLSFLKDSKIPVSGINLGPVHRKDVIRASVMLERAKEYAQILAFDVKVDKEADDLAEEMGVKIFRADIIYHLFDRFTQHMKEITEAKRRDQAPQAVFPAMLRIVPDAVFNKRNPIVIGVDVVEGQLRIGTPLAAISPEHGIVPIGRVQSIELNHKNKEVAKRGEPAVAIKIAGAEYETPKMIGRHFSEKDPIVSLMTRQSIDILKETFRNDLTKDEWVTVVKIKKLLKID